MKNSISTKDLMSYLTDNRMMSLENLAFYFDTLVTEIGPLVSRLEQEGRIRFGRGGCSGSCNSCSTCGDEDSGLLPSTIVISLEKKEKKVCLL